MDVLANYTTYHTFWKIEKATDRRPASTTPRRPGGRSRGSSACTRYQLAQKAEIIVEHFRAHTAQADAGAGEGDGRDLLAAARRPLQAGDRPATSPSTATTTSGRWSRSPASSTTAPASR